MEIFTSTETIVSDRFNFIQFPGYKQKIKVILKLTA